MAELDAQLDSMFEPQAEAPVEQQQEAPQPEAPAEPEPAPEQQPEPIVEAKQDHTVPLPKYLDTRDELKETKRRLAELEAAQQQRPPANVPDPYDDPAGYNAYMGQQLQTALQAQKVDMSWQFAVQQHGAETTEAAKQWAIEKAQSDPVFNAALDTAFANQPMPIDWIVRQHKQDSLVKQIGEDPDEYVRRRAAELGLTAPAAVAPVQQTYATTTQQAPKPAVPPRSLVDVPSHGGVDHVPTGLQAGMEAVFGR